MSARVIAPRVDPGVYQHRKTLAVAERLGLDPYRVVYHLTLMWSSVLARRSDVALDLSNRDDVPRSLAAFKEAVRYDGTVNELVAALRAAGFLDKVGSRIVVHDLSDWQGKQASATTMSVAAPPHDGTISAPGDDADLPPGLRGSNWYGHFMWWLREGFGFEGYQSNKADAGYFRQAGSGVDMSLVAEIFIAISEGRWGDDFDKRVLSARHAMGKINAFAALKRRRQVDTIIPLTVAGARFHPSARKRAGGLAGGDAGASAGGAGAPRPSADDSRAYLLGEHPKYG